MDSSRIHKSHSGAHQRSFATTKWLWLVLLAALGGLFFATGNAWGQDNEGTATGSATTGLLSDRVSRQLVKAQNYSDNKQHKEAQQLLETLVNARLNDYEAAVVYQSLGYVCLPWKRTRNLVTDIPPRPHSH